LRTKRVPADANRKRLYAEGAAVLDEDCHVVGAEALFDQALTNGLLVIATSYIPGHPAGDPKKKQPSASAWLTQLSKQAGVTDGVAQLPTGKRAQEFDEQIGLRYLDHEELVPLYVKQLRDALRRTQAARHGRGPGEQVRPEDVAALLALDAHPALGALVNHYLDRDWRRAQIADRSEQARAADYLDLLDEDEVDRRANHSALALASMTSEDDMEPQDCSVCGRTALLSSGGDDFGYGITAGTCLVCSYRRSDRIAYDLGVDLEWELRWESQ
jgi:hypothetical protein